MNSTFISFYTHGKYMGKEKLTTYKEQFLTLRSWILSGNDLKIDGVLINDVGYITKLYPH